MLLRHFPRKAGLARSGTALRFGTSSVTLTGQIGAFPPAPAINLTSAQ
jgi:hypothetical protein